jgi:hypothetical protein
MDFLGLDSIEFSKGLIRFVALANKLSMKRVVFEDNGR